MDLASGHLNALDALDSEATFANCEDQARYKASLDEFDLQESTIDGRFFR
jgi:hypothetical protein